LGEGVKGGGLTGWNEFISWLLQEIFEKHNVVFTIGASLASAGAAWAG